MQLCVEWKPPKLTWMPSMKLEPGVETTAQREQWRLRKQAQRAAAAERKAAEAQGLPVPPPPPRGRPKKRAAVAPPSDTESEDEHCVSGAHRLTLRLMEIIAEAAAAERAAAEQAEKEVARAAEEQAAAADKAMQLRQAREAKERHRLAPDRGYVEASLTSHVVDPHATCVVCMQNADEDDNPPDCRMPCCEAHMHRACIMQWHALGQLGKCMTSAPKRGGGSKPVRMASVGACPACKAPLTNARIGRRRH